MPLVDKVVPDLQAFQEQARVRGDRLANLESVVGPGFDDQDAVDAPLAKRQRRGATGNAAAKYDRCMRGIRRRSVRGTPYSPDVLEFIGQGLISISSSWLSTSRYCIGL